MPYDQLRKMAEGLVEQVAVYDESGRMVGVVTKNLDRWNQAIDNVTAATNAIASEWLVFRSPENVAGHANAPTARPSPMLPQQEMVIPAGIQLAAVMKEYESRVGKREEGLVTLHPEMESYTPGALRKQAEGATEQIVFMDQFGSVLQVLTMSAQLAGDALNYVASQAWGVQTVNPPEVGGAQVPFGSYMNNVVAQGRKYDDLDKIKSCQVWRHGSHYWNNLYRSWASNKGCSRCKLCWHGVWNAARKPKTGEN